MLHEKMVALPCWPFELSPLNELYMGKLVRSIPLIPYEIFDDILYTCISGQDSVSHARMIALSYWLFESSPLNEFYRGKLYQQGSTAWSPSVQRQNLVLSISLILRYFDNISKACISGQDSVSHAKVVALPCWQWAL